MYRALRNQSTQLVTLALALALAACTANGAQPAEDGAFLADAAAGDGPGVAAGDGPGVASGDGPVAAPGDGPVVAPDAGTDAGSPTGAGWPNSTNTGIAGVGLTIAQLKPSPTTGVWKITTPNAVFDTFHHKGSIEIEADNVTLKRCYVEHTGGYKVVAVSGKNAVIEDCTIVGKSVVGKTCVAAISPGNYTARRVNVSGCADGFKISGDVTIEDSYSHGLFKYGTSATGTHNDSMQVNNAATAKTVIIRGNAFYHFPCQSNRHLQGGGVIAKLVLEKNFFYGAHGVLNLGSGIAGGQFKDNVLAGSRLKGPFSDGGGNHTGPGLYTGSKAALVFSGNTFESGESADTDTRTKGKYQCVKTP